jgi:peptidoglycan-associated lipoprotein
MRRKTWVLLAMLLVLPAFMLTTSCSKKATVKKEAAGMSDEEKARLEAERQKELERQRKLEEERLKKETAMKAARMQFEQENVYFAYDSSTLDATAQATLRNKAQFLRDNQGVPVTVEGHCDERGTVEYNIALGERRAEAAKKFLVDLGIDAGQLTTISYGEERPLVQGHDEAAWAKNRRDQFVVK